MISYSPNAPYVWRTKGVRLTGTNVLLGQGLRLAGLMVCEMAFKGDSDPRFSTMYAYLGKGLRLVGSDVLRGEGEDWIGQMCTVGCVRRITGSRDTLAGTTACEMDD